MHGWMQVRGWWKEVGWLIRRLEVWMGNNRWNWRNGFRDGWMDRWMATGVDEWMKYLHIPSVKPKPQGYLGRL